MRDVVHNPGARVKPLLTVTGLSVGYGAVVALRGVSVDVHPGEFVAIIGNNGAGKSSMLNAIAGVVKPSSGEILFADEAIHGRPSHAIVRRGISLVPEGRRIFADQSVGDNLRLGGFARSRGNGLDGDIERMFELFPILKQRLRQTAGSLSGGEQQMLALARGLLSKPKLLMIDEMSLGLAPRVVEALFPVLERLNREGLAILLVEQLATFALRFSHRAYVVENARILLSGSSAKIAADTRVIESYLGRRSG